MTKAIEILPPKVPNFARFRVPRGTYASIPIGTFTKQEAKAFAELLSDTFIKHWESQQTT